MNKSFLSLLACAALVACAAGPDGAVGAAGVQGPQGEQGIQGEAGANGADAPAREGSIVSVTGGSVVAGSSAEMHVMGQYTEWTEAPEITTDYPGISLSAVVTSPVSMVITITAAEDVRGGEANLVMGDLQLPKTVEVIPAARFVLDEGQVNPVRPGQNFSGKIVFSDGFGLSGTYLVKFNAEDEDPVDVLLTEAIGVEASNDMGVSSLTVEGFISPTATNSTSDWRVLTMSGGQTITVPGALQIADAPAVDLMLGGTAEASLENGFGLYRLTNGPGEMISAGTVVRVEALNADFPLSMLVSIPGTEDDPALAWSNTPVDLNDAVSPTVEFIAPRSGVYFLNIDHAESLSGAEFTFTASSAEVVMNQATGQPQTVTLERPGHSAWFARSITAGQRFGWVINPTEESDASPAVRFYRHYTNEDEIDVFGDPLRLGQLPLFLTGQYSSYPQGVSWPEAWGEAVIIWRVTDANLGGGAGYGMTFTGTVE
jgi:hypothetical protein